MKSFETKKTLKRSQKETKKQGLLEQILKNKYTALQGGEN